MGNWGKTERFYRSNSNNNTWEHVPVDLGGGVSHFLVTVSRGIGKLDPTKIEYK